MVRSARTGCRRFCEIDKLTSANCFSLLRARKFRSQRAAADLATWADACRHAAGLRCRLSQMNRITEISFSDAVAIVEPGVFTADLKAAVRAQKLFYPPDPASMKNCTIGGNVATNAGGPRCLKYGVTRNYVIGLEVVLANGEVLRTGGRVHKNKTGFDLIGLFVGSEGMLGVVTEITLRLLPLPPARATLSAAFATAAQAAEAVQAIFAAGFLPSFAGNRRSFHVGSGAARSGQNACARGKRTSARRSRWTRGKCPRRICSDSQIAGEKKTECAADGDR